MLLFSFHPHAQFHRIDRMGRAEETPKNGWVGKFSEIRGEKTTFGHLSWWKYAGKLVNHIRSGNYWVWYVERATVCTVIKINLILRAFHQPVNVEFEHFHCSLFTVHVHVH